MINFFKYIATMLITSVLSIVMVFCFGAAVGFWFKFAKLGFDAATQIVSNFL